MEIFGKTGRIWPDWGNTAWADMAGLGSIGLMSLAGLFIRWALSTFAVTFWDSSENSMMMQG